MVSMQELMLNEDGTALGPTPVRTLFTVRHGTIGSFAWSNNGNVLAFTNDRGDHGFIGCVVTFHVYLRLPLALVVFVCFLFWHHRHALHPFTFSHASMCARAHFPCQLGHVAVDQHRNMLLECRRLYNYAAGPAGRIVWVAPSYDSDQWPHFSPDGKQLAFLRVRDMTGADGRDARCVRNGYCGAAGKSPEKSIIN